MEIPLRIVIQGFRVSVKSYKELKKLELIPYEKCIASGVDMLMTAHIQYPNIETDTYLASDGTQISLPATLSKKIITDILRGDLCGTACSGCECSCGIVRLRCDIS